MVRLKLDLLLVQEEFTYASFTQDGDLCTTDEWHKNDQDAQWSPKPRKSCFYVTAPAILVQFSPKLQFSGSFMSSYELPVRELSHLPASPVLPLCNLRQPTRLKATQVTPEQCLGNHWTSSVPPLCHHRWPTATSGDQGSQRGTRLL